MSKPLLPPRGIFASTRLVFHRSLSAAVKETVLQLMALSWADNQHSTPPLTYLQLEELTGKDRRTLRGHLRALREINAIVGQQYLQEGIFSLNLASWLFRNEPAGRAETWSAGAGEPREVDPPGDVGDERPASAGAAQPREGRKPASTRGSRRSSAPLTAKAPEIGCEPLSRPGGRPLTKAFQRELLAFGVFPSLLQEVASSPYTERDLRALLAWCKIDAPDSAAGLFIGRMRAGAKAPKAYHSKPCDVCGQYGKHAPDCRRRYAQDIYVNS